MFRQAKLIAKDAATTQGWKCKAATLRASLAILVTLLLLMMSAPASANGDNPTLAFLRFGQSPSFALTDMAVLDMLQVYGYINEDERATLEDGSDLRGENINILYRDAGFDFPTANLMVEDALDEGADVVLTVSTQVGTIAVGAMSDMEDPPALIFTIVTDVHESGLASATCIKPPNVTGSVMHIDYDEYLNISYLQDPDFQSIGFIGDANDPATPGNMKTAQQVGDQLGFTVEFATVVTPADYAIATASLVDKNVDAIGLLPHTGSAAGIPSVVNAAVGMPIFSPLVSDVIHGVTIAAGFEGWYREGVQAARMVIAYIEGELDIATTGIASTPSFAVAVNLDAAEEQGVVITEALLAEADYIIQDGIIMSEGGLFEIPGEIGLRDLSLEERRAEDAAFLETLHCSPDMIAEQMSALATAES